MRQVISPKEIVIRAPAKINLVLQVGAKRRDGFHTIRSLIYPVAIFDRLRIVKGGAGLRLRCPGKAELETPANLCLKAAELFCRERGVAPGFQITLFKRIPLAAGLGGGSSDAAATLLGLNALTGRRLSRERLLALAAAVGSDVPFFIDGRPAWVGGRGEIIKPLAAARAMNLLVACPEVRVSTAWAYAELDRKRLTGQKGNATEVPPRGPRGDLFNAFNDLAGVIAARHPVVWRLRELLIASGAWTAVMTGSGPAIVAVFSSRKRAAGAASSLPRELAPWRRITQTLC